MTGIANGLKLTELELISKKIYVIEYYSENLDIW